MAEVTTPATPVSLKSVDLITPFSYAFQSCFQGLTSTSNYWSWVANGNCMTWVDTGDPASFPYNVQPVLAAGFMWAHNVYAVPGFQQVLVGGPFWGGLDLWDITAPLSPWVEYAGFGSYYMGFTSTGGWISPRNYGDIGMYLNKLDYNPPIFSGGLANDGWIAPTGAPATLPAATTLKVHVEDDVAVTRVLFVCYYNDPCAQDPNYFDDGGAIVLGYGALNDADGLWTLDVNAADIPGTDYDVLPGHCLRRRQQRFG